MHYDRSISASMRERKNLACALELKSIDGEGRFAGYASVFNVLDQQKDIILRGAFAGTIQGRVQQIKLLWQHQQDEPIGYFTAMFEDKRGLYVEGQLLMQVARAREALALLKSGALSGLSIGYSPLRYTTDEKTGIRKLAEVALWEISLVTFPANEHAAVTVVKTARRPATRKDWKTLAAVAEKSMQALWETRGICTKSAATLRDECTAIRMECEWLQSYIALLQAKMYADRELAVKFGFNKDDDFDLGDFSLGDDFGSDFGNDSGGGSWEDEPRIPAGEPDGGEWTTGEGSDAGSSLGEGTQIADSGQVMNDAETVGTTPGGLNYGQKIQDQMQERNWTPEQMDSVEQTAPSIDALNKTNGEPFTPATRYEDPTTGRSMVVDNATREVIQIGEPDFIHNVETGDLPGAVMRPSPVVNSPEITPGGGGGGGGFDDILHPGSRISHPRNDED